MTGHTAPILSSQQSPNGTISTASTGRGRGSNARLTLLTRSVSPVEAQRSRQLPLHPASWGSGPAEVPAQLQQQNLNSWRVHRDQGVLQNALGQLRLLLRVASPLFQREGASGSALHGSQLLLPSSLQRWSTPHLTLPEGMGPVLESINSAGPNKGQV